METIMVNTQQAYPIFIEAGLLEGDSLAEYCAELAKEWVIITDDTVHSLYGQALSGKLSVHFDVNLISIPPGENNKTREMKVRIEDHMQTLACGRHIGIIAMGGGVVTDLAGFVAATYCRGVPAVYVPTTLLAMVDATLGGKTGVNTAAGKNLIGTFTQPRAVFIDANVLTTLSNDELVNGVVESIKHALIADGDFFEFLDQQAEKILKRDSLVLKELISWSIDIKRQIIEEDEFEKGKRELCNFGHTVGHALESYYQYSISHGMAVALGMLVESYLSTNYSGLSHGSLSRIKKCLSRYVSFFKVDAMVWSSAAFLELLQKDKKNRDKTPHFVMLDDIGKPNYSGSKYAIGISAIDFAATLDGYAV